MGKQGRSAGIPATEALIRQIEWFRSLEEDAVRFLAASAVFRTLVPNQLFVSRTTTAPGLAIVLSGGLRSTLVAPDGRELVVSILGPHSLWGVVGALDGEQNPNDVYAEGATNVLVLPRREVLGAMEAYPTFQSSMTKLLCYRLRKFHIFVENIALSSIHDRLKRLLLTLSWVQNPVDRENSSKVLIVITQDTIAQMLNVSRVSANKALQVLVKEGIVEVGYGHLSVKDLSKLGPETQPECMYHL